MYDLITIGSIAIDLFFQGESLTYKEGRFQLAVGGKYFVDKLYESVGGGGANVAIGGAKQGLKTAVIGKVGENPFKNIILNELESSGVSIRLCILEKDYLNISSILLTQKGERTVINYQPPHEHIFSKDIAISMLNNTKFVYLGNLPDVSQKEKIEILNYCKKNSIKTVVNLGVIDCRRSKKEKEEFLRHVDILLVNGHEMADIIEKNYAEMDYSNELCYSSFKDSDKVIVVTEGGKGSYGFYKNKVYHQKAEEVKGGIIDTTGAGDGYSAGFIAGYYKNGDIELAMKDGALYSAKILAKLGAN